MLRSMQYAVDDFFMAERPANSRFIGGMIKGLTLPSWKLMGKWGAIGFFIGYVVTGLATLSLKEGQKP